MYQWHLKKLNLEFKTEWTINGGSANQKTNDFIVVKKNELEGWGEISASTKNNDIGEITKDLNSINYNNLQTIDDIYQLNVCPQVRAGLEMAWLHLQCKLENKTIFEILEINSNHKSPTSFSIPILNEKDTIHYIQKSNLQRFSSCKLKIQGLNSIASLETVAKHYNGPIRVDANESFNSASEVLKFIELAAGINLQFIEQPLDKNNFSEAKILKSQSKLPIIGDESLLNNDITPDYLDYFHGLNIKLMKAGGYKQAVNQLKQCREMGLQTMVGCNVETSLNISAALNISANCDWLDLDGHLLLKDDPFSLLDEKNGIIIRK